VGVNLLRQELINVIGFSSESLDHKNKQTTQNYLANFEDEEKKEVGHYVVAGFRT
jgi:hypothetical protein